MLEMLPSVMWTIASFMVAICILVAVHEYGHFYVARKCGVRVLRFSIGFGPKLLIWQGKGHTEYVLALIPLGGYVKMLDEREGLVSEVDRPYAFSSKAPWQRILIAFAGPLANFILAVVLFWLLALQGENQRIPIVGKVEAGSIAQKMGLESGQKIIEIDSKPVNSSRDVLFHLVDRLGQSGNLTFTLSYPNSDLRYISRITLDNWLKDAQDPDPVKGLGFGFIQPPAKIKAVLAKSAADQAGMQSGDLVVAVDGSPISNWREWVEYVSARPDQEILVEVERNAQTVALSLVPALTVLDTGKSIGRAGVTIDVNFDDYYHRVKYSPGEAVGRSFEQLYDTAELFLLSLKKLIVGEISVKNLSGPVGIAKIAGDSAEAGSWAFISFLAMISVYLGVINLMPIPVLDGGHIIYAAIEWIKGSPVSERIQALGYQLGLCFIIGLTVVALYNDVGRF